MNRDQIKNLLEIAATEGVDAALESLDGTEAEDLEAHADAMRALDDDPTGQDDVLGMATRMGCGADDTFDKSGARRRSRFNDAGEVLWTD